MSAETRVTLLVRVKNQHDEKAWQEFEKIYSVYLNIVFRYLKLDATDVADLTQETLVYLWKQLPTFNYDQEKGRFRGWLRRVAANKAMNMISKRQNRQKLLKEKYQPTDSITSELEKTCEAEWQQFLAKEAWERVKDQFSEQAGICFMRMASGESSVELAEELGIPENTVRVNKRRVEKRLNREIRYLIEEYS